MKHIEKIIINNARRLGKNIEIEFGTGATIILAPNGTGKTTIFEAIELALTGQIKRLEDSPDTIIRNGLSEMDVRLDFSEGKYCQAKYVRGGSCKQSGNYKELFQIANKSSIPYLFRLTHFLEQRNKEWFVDKDAKNAGNLLSQLPLGKDLQNIISKKTSLLRVIGTTETSAIDSLNEAKKKLSEFEELIKKRDGLATETQLTPLKEIVAKLLIISNLIGSEDYGEDNNLAKINLYFEKIRVSLNQERNQKNDLDIKLNTLKERTQLYASNQELLSSKQAAVFKLAIDIEELNPIIEHERSNLQGLRERLSNAKDEIKKLNMIKSMLEEAEQQRSYLIAKKSEQEQNKKVLGDLQKSHEMMVEYLKKCERIRDQYKLIEDSINAKKDLLNQAENKRDFQRQWQNLSDVNNEIIKTKIPTLEKRKNDCLELKSRLDEEVFKLENEYLMKKNYLDSLNEASGAIQDAVSNIRKNLAKNQRSCPVCKAVYEPEDLIERIEKSLNTLNPAIPHAIKEEKKASDALGLAKEKQINENKKLQDILAELHIEKNRMETNQKIISENLLPQFPGLKTPEEAHLYNEDQIFQITKEIKRLEVKRSQLEPHEDSDKMDNVKLKKSEEERLINDLVAKNVYLQNEINAADEKIDNINKSLRDEQRDSVFKSLTDKLCEESEMIDKITHHENILSKKEAEIKQYKDTYLLESEALSRMKSSQDGIIAEWQQIGLGEQPNLEALKIKQDVIKKSIDELEMASKNLNKIEQELANWRAAENYSEINQNVKKQIGDASEEAYLESLESSVSQKSSILENIREKKGAVNLFFENVMLESEKIHEQLNAINEPWKGLLKRIVISPLISDAPLLSNTISRNKPIAKTSAVIHNKNTDIAHIASEAQLTDLQLTLMLSMANRYQWTPWKALLLDDPTQHHDLVHASSVFDVLRDYIVEFDYQILMSTHDSIQARYFERKLENEGVRSKIYQLVDRKGGVTAERIV